LPAPPLPSARERAGLRGLSRSGYPSFLRTPGPLMGFGSLSGFPTDRSGRPVSGSTPPMGFIAPTTTPRTDPVHPGLPHPAPSDLRVSTLSSACSLRAAPDPKIESRPWGSPFRA
jgi:hypothetical protein